MATIFAAPGNNVSTTVGLAYTAGDGHLNLATGTGSKFPTLSGGQYYRVTVCQVAFAYSPTATTSNYTIYKATGISTDQLTGLTVISTGLDATGNTDRNYAIGDIVEIRVTSGTLGDIHTAVNNLEYLSAPVSVTGTIALTSSAFGTTQLCSGTSANYTVTLPAPVAGGIIVFRMAPGLTKLVTIAQHASETIDGAASRVMWANETAILSSDGTNWFKVAGKSIPMACWIYATSTGTSVPNNSSDVVVPMTNSYLDNTGLMANTSSGYINVLRTGVYAVGTQLVFNPAVTAGQGESKINVNGTTYISGNIIYVPIGGYCVTLTSGAVSANAGDYIQASAFQAGLNGTSSQSTFTGTAVHSSNYITANEIVSW